MKKYNNCSRFLNWKKSLSEEIEFYRNTLPKARKDELLEKIFLFTRSAIENGVDIIWENSVFQINLWVVKDKFTESWFKKFFKFVEFRNKLVDRESISNLESVIILKIQVIFNIFRKSNDAEYLKLKSEKTLTKKNSPKNIFLFH